ncbi:MAG: glycosyltransferase family 2 protein [Acidobacteriia bacterium]|nr:glycosyltransferase family 2 protein [Terriglobia bacterium]
MGKLFVSVLIDTYNHEAFIEQAIRSVLDQDFPAEQREIIVVDDGSTDRTPDLVRQFEPQVRLIRKPNGGQASAFNAGIPECKGEIIAFLDGDDWWDPRKLSLVAAAFEAHPELGIVGHGIIIFHRDGREQTETLREGFRFQANTMEGALLFRRRGAFLGTSRMAIRSELLRRIGSVPEEIEIQADEYLFTLASFLMEARILPEPLTYYRLHEANRFQLAGFDLHKLRHKQRSLAVLAGSLSRQLENRGASPQLCRAVVEYTRACADQLRLMIDGGWPWETTGVEWKLYGIIHPEAPYSHRLFKLLILLGALVTPPKCFYGAQRILSQSGFYRRVRARCLPVPEMQNLERNWRVK